MQPDILHVLLSNTWSTLLIVLFFGGSIFVHELGHYLLARARGVHVEVFSVGFGPSIFSWKGEDGTRYQVAWIPLGGYVLLPQIADLGPIEGESSVKAEDLPPVSYPTKLLVFAAGAAFNILFAFCLACVIWRIGQLENNESQSTQIGYVSSTLEMPDGTKVPSPAAQAGLRVGDVVKAVDGHAIADWGDLTDTLVTSTGRDSRGDRSAVFTVERDGKTLDITVHPVLSGADKMRRVGIAPGYELDVYSVLAGSGAAKAGLLAGDRIVSVNGTPIRNAGGLVEELALESAAPVRLGVLRSGTQMELIARPVKGDPLSGDFELSTGLHLTHPSPFDQLAQPFLMTFRTVWGLIDPHSDIGLSKVSGPVGILHIFHSATEAGVRAVIRFTILINVNLAILNMLPIPVLDGGQIVFATIARLRGRPLPVNLVVGVQSVFMVLLVSLVLYVSIFDLRRWNRDAAESRAPEQTAPAKP